MPIEMKPTLLRLAVFFLVTISANEYSNAQAATNYPNSPLSQNDNPGGYDSSKQWETQNNNGQPYGLRQSEPQKLSASSSRQGDSNKKQNPNFNNNNVHAVQAFSSFSSLQVAAESEGRLATRFMAVIGNEIPVNFIINPFGIWTVTAMIYSVADGRTANELGSILSVNDPASLEKAYAAAYNAVQKDTFDVESKTANMVARPKQKTFKPGFKKLLQNVYMAEELEVTSFAHPEAAKTINKWAAAATKQRITDIVSPDDLRKMTLVMATACFFKGRWKYPFNHTETFTDDFKNENDASLGSINMMRSRQMYKHGYNTQLETQVIELPYGDGNVSMVVFLPRRKVRLQTVLDQMSGKPLNDLIPEMSEEEVDLSFPSFTTESSMPLNRVYSILKADRMLNPGAELPGLSEQDYISKIHHTAEIETSEEGTTASAVTSAQVVYKVSAASFHANRPFVYFINHTPSRLVLFSGRYVTPNA